MSADTGIIIRKNVQGKFVAQVFFASSESYPDVDDPRTAPWDTLEDAILWCKDWYTEYGITIDPNVYTKEENMINPQRYVRKPFPVTAVQVSAENMDEAAKWCQGTVEEVPNSTDQYVRVDVNRPLTDRQTKAFAGDWILHSTAGYKVYTAKAFEKSFRLDEDSVSHRDASTGQYVTEEFATENPDTTVSETS